MRAGPHDGAISAICNTLSISSNSRTTVESVLREAFNAHSQGCEFNRTACYERPGARLIADVSTEAAIITDSMEQGSGLFTAMIRVNAYRKAVDPLLEHVGRSAVYNAYLRMKPVVSLMPSVLM